MLQVLRYITLNVMRLRPTVFASAVLIVTSAPVAANVCAIDRVIRGAAEATIFFHRSANYGYRILVLDAAGRPVSAEGEWVPNFVGVNGVVLHERGLHEVQAKPFMRLSTNMTLVLSDNHFGCRATFSDDGRHLRVQRESAVHLIPVEMSERVQ